MTAACGMRQRGANLLGLSAEVVARLEIHHAGLVSRFNPFIPQEDPMAKKAAKKAVKKVAKKAAKKVKKAKKK